ncbi:heterogeneous nuclear ribonucleoprotein 27C-like isoform X2 [Oppia nitens]|uniref:heterogeneous nuclear ribonucleoprotein 27C-like isoform X2 n=1 Tax=Oppia nitens TaxID=1686743 RepID=UPI0023DAEFEA|nr:heterogeneous nuclear ribonucleoprotein 27C-like isoform X2 [Oppia nitens]
MTLDVNDEPGKLFIGGLSWETTIEKLTEYFCRYGEVSDCVVMKNAETGRSRGFGFVTFKDPSCVQIVMASGPHALDGRTIDPKECNPKTAQKGKRDAKVGNFPKVFLGGLPPNVNETVLRDYFSKFGKVIEVVIMYDQEKKKTRGFGFLSFDSEDTIDKVVKEHFVSIGGKQVEVKRAEPRDKSSGNSMKNHMGNSPMQQHGGGHPMAGAMPPWNPMWGPQGGPPMHVPPPPGQPPPPTAAGAPIPGMPNGILPAGYTPAWNSSQQTGAYAAGNGWTQPQNYPNYQQWTGYGYPPPGWQGYGYGPYNTTYPGYGQAAAAGQGAANATQTPVAQAAIAGQAAANSAVGTYMQAAGATVTPGGAQVVAANAGAAAPQASVFIWH